MHHFIIQTHVQSGVQAFVSVGYMPLRLLIFIINYKVSEYFKIKDVQQAK